MAYDIKLYAHGVPDGQDIWGNKDARATYIETFYGRRSNVESQMFIEVKHCAGQVNVYYTYYKCGNILEKGGRSGSYFALTLRINFYYADVQNMYNLLEAAFNKFMLGTVLKSTGDGYRFLVSRFSEADNELETLEKEMEHYLMQFSIDSDFIPLNGFKYNSQNEGKKLNLLEAIPSIVTNSVKSEGKISISSLYPSSKEQHIIQKKDAEIQDVKSNARKQIEDAKKESQQKVQMAQKDKEDMIEKYKNVDNERSQLNSQLQQIKAEKTNLETKIDQKENELKNAEENEKKCYELKQELARKNKILSDIKSCILDFGKNEKNVSDIQKAGKITQPKPKVAISIEPKISLGSLIIIIMLIVLIILNITQSSFSMRKSVGESESKAKKENVVKAKRKINKSENYKDDTLGKSKQ